jgi:hypothetical protein
MEKGARRARKNKRKEAREKAPHKKEKSNGTNTYTNTKFQNINDIFVRDIHTNTSECFINDTFSNCQ